MSYLLGNMTSWLVGKPASDEDELIKIEKPKSDDVEQKKDGVESEVVEGKVAKEEGGEKSEGEEGGNSLEQDFEEVSQMAYDKAKDLGSYIFNLGMSYSQQVVKTAQNIKGVIEEKTLIGDFSKEQENFKSTNTRKKVSGEGCVLPWVGYNEEETMKQQILELSKDKRNLLRNPPSGIQFTFDFDTHHPIALSMLQIDPTLNSLRFQLVPKQIKEELFWRNYFYRVSLIKQATQLNSLNHPTDPPNNKAAPSMPHQPIDEQEKDDNEEYAEFVSDSFESGMNDDEFTTAMLQLNSDGGGEGKGGVDGGNPGEVGGLGKAEKKCDGVAEKSADNEDEEIAAWEAELQAELVEYEVVSDSVIDADLEQEILGQVTSQ